MQLKLWLASCLALATASPVAVQYVQAPQAAENLGHQVQQQYRLVQQSAPAQQVQYVQQPQAAQGYSQQPSRQQYYAAQQAAAAAGPSVRPTAGHRQQTAQEEELPEDYDSNPQYQFSFDVKDDQFTNYQNRKEQREGGKISGSYSVVDSDGFIRTVKYTADPLEGFKAQVTREPTDIVVKIPQPQPQYQQQQEAAGPSRVQYVRPKAVAYANPQPQYAQAPQVQYVKAGPQQQQQEQQYETQYVQQPQAASQAYAGLAQAARAQQQVQYTSPTQYSSPQYAVAQKSPSKASAIGYSNQPGSSVVYQAYQQ